MTLGVLPPTPGGGGSLPYLGHMGTGMCCCEWHGFQAVESGIEFWGGVEYNLLRTDQCMKNLV